MRTHLHRGHTGVMEKVFSRWYQLSFSGCGYFGGISSKEKKKERRNGDKEKKLLHSDHKEVSSSIQNCLVYERLASENRHSLDFYWSQFTFYHPLTTTCCCGYAALNVSKAIQKPRVTWWFLPTDNLEGLASLLQPWLRGILLRFWAVAGFTNTLWTPVFRVESVVVVKTLPGDPDLLPAEGE